MNIKLFGAICLVAGTAIGAGILALPMTLARLGLIPSLMLMLLVWAVMYYSALVNVELNLRAGTGLSLGMLAARYSGRIAQVIGASSLMLLMYALLSAYLYGGASVLQNFIEQITATTIERSILLVLFAGGLGFLLVFSLTKVEKINRILFVLLLSLIAVLILTLLPVADIATLPLFEPLYSNRTLNLSLLIVLPTVFTSFGFQVIFHTLTNYCDKDPKMLKKVFFYGSLIPFIVYALWTISVLAAIHTEDPIFYQKILKGGIEVGELVAALSQAKKWPVLKIITLGISILAIFTSLVGVTLGLMDTWKCMLGCGHKVFKWHIIVLAFSLIPSVLVALYVPNAFLKALAFAGMILAVLALLLPLYLLYVSNKTYKDFFYPCLKSKTLYSFALLLGICVIVCEIINLV